ncbi:site-specific integrase [Rhodococcus sp. NPDC049939]|uniref:tyrosine-type recombinase/integrase n=1 Tax=Rhodococcus sp. NPDC049939 TaxID=3155511 RepID=UPI0033EC379C
MTAGRPPLTPGTRGNIFRKRLPDGRWRARTRFCGPDGVVRLVQRDSPPGQKDSYGRRAVEALESALAQFSDGGGSGRMTGRTTVAEAVEAHLDTEVRGVLALRTIDTYESVFRVLKPHLGKLRLGEFTARGATRILAAIAAERGPGTARHAKTLLTGAFRLAVDEGAVVRSVIRDVEIRKKTTAKKVSRALSAAELVDLLRQLQASTAPLPPMTGARKDHTTRTVAEFVGSVDLYDPILLAAATGLRRSELLGLLWTDYTRERGELTVTGHVIRAGKTATAPSRLLREAGSKTELSARTVALPEFAREMLDRRRTQIRVISDGVPPVIFPSAAGQLRDPDTFAAQWRRIRGAIGYEWVTLHTFRKSTATVLDASGLTTREVADVLGHSSIAMTQSAYFGRGRTHTSAAEALDQVVGEHLR